MIEIKNLSKNYDDKKALVDLNLTVESGKIFGLLGHNGAGKSTTIKSLVSIHKPNSGSIKINGMELSQHRSEIKKMITYVPDTPDVFLQLTASEYWNLVAKAYDLNDEDILPLRKKLVELFHMENRQNEVMSNFSHGIRQKAVLIASLLSDPAIWVLDEPFQGLDPQAVFDLKQLMKVQENKGKTVLFSTHDLQMAQTLCDDLAILKSGELIYEGSMTNLRKQYNNESLEKIYLQLTDSDDSKLFNEIEGEVNA